MQLVCWESDSITFKVLWLTWLSLPICTQALAFIWIIELMITYQI